VEVTPQVEQAQVGLLLPTVTPRPSEAGAPISLKPGAADVGWWRSGESGQSAAGDSYLNAGRLDGDTFVSAIRYDLRSVPRGAPIVSAELALTGLSDDRLDRTVPVNWLVQLISERDMGDFQQARYDDIYEAPVIVTLPVLRSDAVGAGKLNQWRLDESARVWLESQVLAAASSVFVRIAPQFEDGGDTMMAWDSGAGSKSLGNAPTLTLNLGATPPTPPPVPTEDLLVATPTPTPQNIETVVALQMTETAQAVLGITNTPLPAYATPTPMAKSVATANAIARELGLPAVLLETPVPQSQAEADDLIAYATFVALTTGTYTPVPTAYVTPFLVVPPPPALNVATAVARPLDLPLDPAGTPWPYNAIEGTWVEATPTPGNVATAAAMVLQATAEAQQFGTATPTAWGQLVYTPVPPPQPTATPTTPLIQSVESLTPTPVVEPTEPPPAVLPEEMRNRILFKSDRFGTEETFSYDPATGSTARINATWAWPLAQQQLALSPDGRSLAIVKADDQNILQIYVRSLEYGTDTQITSLRQQGDDTRSFDPAWSPSGEWIAFVSTNSGNDEVYRVSPDGQVVEQLTFNTWEWDKHPTWSPDGSQIVFYSNRDTKRRQLWIMNADGSDQRLLAASEMDDWDPAWTR
jgi:hypothetical protein